MWSQVFLALGLGFLTGTMSGRRCLACIPGFCEVVAAQRVLGKDNGLWVQDLPPIVLAPAQGLGLCLLGRVTAADQRRKGPEHMGKP